MHRETDKSSGSGLPTGAALFHQAQAGCRESLNRLMEAHDGLVHAVVRQQVLGDLPYPDAVQAGRIGLWRAILRFDPQRDTAFSTYAWPSIVHHVWRAVKAHTRGGCQAQAVRKVASSPRWYAEAQVDPERLSTLQSVRQALYALVQRLPKRLQCIVVARYGLDGQPTELYREIGARLSVSGERVRQLHTEALVWLRHPPHSDELRSLLGRHRLADYAWTEAEAQRWLVWRGGRHGRG
jgi:RNA polymerase sigma factor (sigma-70 family)